MKRGRRSGHALYAALATAALLTTGCLTSTPQIHQVAQGLERSMPGTRFEREGGVKLGRLSLHVIRWAGSRSESQEAESLDAKSHDAESHDEAGEAGVETGAEAGAQPAESDLGPPIETTGPDGETITTTTTHVYDGPPPGTFKAFAGLHRVEAGNYRITGLRPDLAEADELERSLQREGWRTLARVRNDDSQAWVVYRLRGSHLKSLLVVAIEGDELSLVRLQGKLENTLVAALRIARGEMDVID